MDLPVEKWKLYISQKLTSLQPSLKEQLCPSMLLRDSFLLSVTLLHPEDEEYLLRLSRYYCVKKDPKMTLSCKEEGNKWFRKKEYRTAAVLYSRALSHAEAGSPEMAVCYANHSAALFHLGQFEVCLEDIKRAQGGGYPEELLPKLLLRRANCLLSLGRFQEATEALDSMEEKMSADQSLEAASHRVLLSKFNQLKLQACKGKSGSVCPPAVSDRIQKDLEPWEESSRIPCASASVSLNFSACKGRHLVAARDILPGELLVREEAFVSVLCPGESLLLQGSAEATLNGQPANEDLRCHHCLKQLLSPVPCQGCSYATYCSHACAQLAWKTYHSRECSLGGLLLTLGVFCHVAFRSVLVAGFAEVSALIKQSHTEEVGTEPVAEAPRGAGEENLASSIPGCGADGRYSSSYKAIFRLLPHTERHSLELRLLCGLSVAALCKRLGEAGLEAIISGKSTPEDQGGPKAGQAGPEWGVPGEAMLRHMLQLQCNAQAVSTLHVSGSENGPVVSSQQVRVATALYPVVSLLNHSCEPNTSVTFSSRSAEVRALQSIPRGHEILHCYGPHRCRMRAAERRKQLRSQYFFECWCPPCLEELQPNSGKRASSQDGLHHKPTQQGQEGLLHCSSGACEVRVHEDHSQHQLRDLRLAAEAALELLHCGCPDQSMELLLKCRLDAKRFLSPTHLVVGEIEDSLAQVYVTLGKWQKAAGHLRSSIQAVEAHYGPSSIEAGQELFKLAQVLFNGRAVPEALHTIQEAQNVLSRHFGPQSPQLQELQEMKGCLEEVLGGGGGPRWRK